MHSTTSLSNIMSPQKSKPTYPKLTPYQGSHKTFGHFKCSKCKKSWLSGNSWANTAQKCLKCDVFVYPFKQVKSEKSKGNIKNKEHPVELCQKCQFLGRSCVNFKTNSSSITEYLKALDTQAKTRSNTKVNKPLDTQTKTRSNTKVNKPLDTQTKTRSNTKVNKPLDTQPKPVQI